MIIQSDEERELDEVMCKAELKRRRDMKNIERTEAETNEPLMPDEGLPEWWPENPYAEPVRIMTPEEFAEAVPDEELRTRISGCCCKAFWRMASDRIEQCLRFRLKEIENGKE